MEANKNKIAELSNYVVKECDKYFYHVALLKKEEDRKVKRFNDIWSVQIYDKKGYDDFKKNKHVLNLDGDFLIHDPEYQKSLDAENEDAQKRIEAEAEAKEEAKLARIAEAAAKQEAARQNTIKNLKDSEAKRVAKKKK